MTMRAWGVIALVVTTTMTLLARMLTLGPSGVPDSSFDLHGQPSPPPGRGVQGPMIIAPATIDVEPSSHTPLLIEIGPPEWVPRDSTLQVQGLSSSVTLSQGRRVSSKLWAVPIAALSRVRIDVASDAAAGQSDVTLTLVGSDSSYLAEAHAAVSINALRVATANRAAKDSQRQDPDAASPSATIELAPADHSTSERKAPETLAKAAGAEPSTPAEPNNPAERGRVTASPAQQDSVVASRELSNPSVVALNEAAELAGAKGGSTMPGECDPQSARPGQREEIAAQSEIKGASALSAAEEPSPAPEGPVAAAQRKAVVTPPEPAKPSTAAREVFGLAGAKGEPSTSAKSDAQSVQPVQMEQIAAQPEVKGAAAEKEAAPSSKGAAVAAQREAVAASPELAKPSTTANEATGAQSAHPLQREQIAEQPEVNGAIALPAEKEAATSPKGADVAAQRETVVESRGLAKPSASAFAQVVHAPRCMTAGGWGTGAFEGFASFMAETAMKNSAKGRLGDDVKIGAVRKKCGQKGLLIECTASAQACR